MEAFRQSPETIPDSMEDSANACTSLPGVVAPQDPQGDGSRTSKDPAPAAQTTQGDPTPGQQSSPADTNAEPGVTGLRRSTRSRRQPNRLTYDQNFQQMA
ncbi:hypothetical protein MTO96_049775 [Rhipicephalus appendiculatus]